MSIKPTPKMTATGVTGAGAIVLVWTLGQFGIDMPETVAVAVGVCIAWAAGWLMPEGRHRATDS